MSYQFSNFGDDGSWNENLCKGLKVENSLIAYVGTNGLTTGANLLKKARKILNKFKQVSLKPRVTCANVLFVNDKQNVEKLRIASDSRVKIFCKQKNMNYINNGNFSEDYLGIKKLHLKKRGNSILAKK